MRFDWLHFLGVPFLGYLISTKKRMIFSISDFIVVMLLSSLYLAYGYLLNDSFDVYKKIKETTSKFKKMISLSYIILLFNICVALYFRKEAVIIILAGAMLSFVYSAPPLLLKAKPFIGTLLNAIGFGLLFLIGYPVSKYSFDIPAYFFMFFFLVMIPIQLIHEVSHFSEDASKGTFTTTCLLKQSNTLYLIILSLIIFLLWSILLIYKTGYPVLLAVITFVFITIVTVYLIFKYKSKNLLDNPKIKSNIKLLSIAYGILITFIFIAIK